MQASFQTVYSKNTWLVNTSMQTCGNASFPLRFSFDFFVNTKCKAIFAAASFRNSFVQLF